MNYNKQKGFGIVEIIVIILAIVVIGALGYVAYTHFINPTKTTSTAKTTSTTAQSQQTAKVDEINSKIAALDYISNKNPNTIGTYDKFTVLSKTDNPTVFLTSPSTFMYEFNGSAYGAAKQGLPTTQVDSIFTDAGLTNTYTAYPLIEKNVYTAVYESSLAVCNVSDSVGSAYVQCVDRDSVTAAESATNDALTALKTQHPYVTSDSLTARYLVSSDKTVTAVYVDNSQGNTNSNEYDAYAVNVSGSWKYVASDVAGEQGLESPSCSILADTDYKDVFKDIAPATCFPTN
jgi:Tfp pilus assembly protein PilE